MEKLMRRWTMSAACFAIGLGLVGLASGQQAGGGRFGGGGTGRLDPVGLLNNPSVKKELDLSEEQIEKVPEAVVKALSEVLNPTQLTRFKQIELQQRGATALGEAKIQDELKLTDDQRSNIKTILEDSRKESKELFGQGGGTDFKARIEKMQNFRKETQTKVMGVLTSDQKKAWRQMTGDPFTIEMPAFGGFGGGTGKGRFNKKPGTDK